MVVNHFKSKRCNDARGADCGPARRPELLEPTRVAAAARLADWLATSPTGVPDDGRLVIGDLNGYAREDPIRLLAERELCRHDRPLRRRGRRRLQPRFRRRGQLPLITRLPMPVRPAASRGTALAYQCRRADRAGLSAGPQERGAATVFLCARCLSLIRPRPAGGGPGHARRCPPHRAIALRRVARKVPTRG
ncbi:hypothetical protein ACU4GD_08735 [Cupriavidus basilensis]